MKTIDSKLFDEIKSIELAIGSFIISTVLFTFYMVSNESSNILVLASPFVVSIVFLNAIMLFHLIDNFIRQHEQRKDIGIKILILLSNIPIALLYFSIMKL
ncbi:MAG: hypothetical protein ABI793_04035 [Flavobacterium sp.]